MAVNVDCTLGELAVAGLRPDVLQVSALSPNDTATAVPPGKTVRFTLRQSAPPHVVTFEDSVFPAWWLNCNPSNGFSHSSWNSGADNLSIYDDSGNKVLRSVGRGTALATGHWQAFAADGSRIDLVCRVKWHTGAQAGIVGRALSNATGKANGLDCIYLWIDSGGLKLGWITNGTISTDQTAAFTPVNGTWYWLRLQAYGDGTVQYRAKIWTGNRNDEDATWDIAWDYPSSDKTRLDERWRGIGIHCTTGTAYFDEWENRLMADADYKARLTVEINGIAHTAAKGNLLAHEYVVSEQWNSVDGTHPDITRWSVEVLAVAAHDTQAADQDADVKWNNGGGSITLETWDWDAASFPGNPPTYSPATESPPGDPIGVDGRLLSSDGTQVAPWGSNGKFIVWGFPESMGHQDMKFNIAPVTWVQALEDFRFNIYTPFYSPVDGEFVIGHPVWTDTPASLVPAQPTFTDHKASVVVKGSFAETFVASIVPQAYVRHDTPVTVCPTIVAWWEGDSSALVSAEMLAEFDASALTFLAREGTTLHLRVQDASTRSQLIALGAKFGPRFFATRGTLVVQAYPATIPADWQVFVGLGEIEVAGHAASVTAGTQVLAGLGQLDVAGHNPTANVPLFVNCTKGSMTVAGADPLVNWYNPAWSYRVKITIDDAKVDADLDDLDVLITEANLPSGFWTHVQSDGGDIVATGANGTNKLKRDLIYINTGTPKLELRVRRSVKNSTDTILYLYYGNASANESNDTDTYAATHELMAPLHEDPSGTAPQMKDRGQNSNNGTSSGSMTSGDSVDAKIHKGLDFDGTDDQISFGNPSSLQITDDLTVMLWVKGDDAISQAVFTKYGSATNIRAWALTQDGTTSSKLRVFISDDGTSDAGHFMRYVSSVTAFEDTTFHHICITFDTGTLKLYIDGAEDTSVDKQLDPSITSIYNTSAAVKCASFGDTTANSYLGIEDQVHIFSRVLTAAEISTRYNNESAPGSFYSCGSEESQ